MNKITLVFAILWVSATCFSQSLPIRAVTVFKNGRSIIEKAGKVPIKNGKWTSTDLPEALFGTFWISSPTDELTSVFTRQDTIKGKVTSGDNAILLEQNLGKPVSLLIGLGISSQPYTVTGTIQKVEKFQYADPYNGAYSQVHLQTLDDKWLIINIPTIIQMEFFTKPVSDFPTKTIVQKVQETLEVNFKNNKPEQEIEMAYLSEQLGWTPVYKLLLTEKGKGRLALRAEVANNAEDIGDTELRLAVGIPNFAASNQYDWLVNFSDFQKGKNSSTDEYGQRMKFGHLQSSLVSGAQNLFGSQQKINYDGQWDLEAFGQNVEGEQAEDYFFYKIRPGNFPSKSRFQYPIFDVEVDFVHFYESQLPDAGPGSILNYRNYEKQRSNEPKIPVYHFIEFLNKSKFPFTTGAVNISSHVGSLTYPISQDFLPYAAPGAKCKVKIAQSSEIKVTHGEGDVARTMNKLQIFTQSYDEVKVEGEVCTVNYKKEPVTIRIHRNIEGAPISSDHPWITKQEDATLRINPSYQIEWTIELKPGEEKKWQYSYIVYVDL